MQLMELLATSRRLHYSRGMTMTSAARPRTSLIRRKRAILLATLLPPPAERRAIRDAVRVSRREVAEELGVSPSTVQGWEADDGFDPRDETAIAYRKLLDKLRILADEMKQAAQVRATTGAAK